MRFLFTLISLIYAINTFSISYEIKINWKKDADKFPDTYYHFDDAIYKGNSIFPFYNILHPINTRYDTFNVSLTEKVFQEIDLSLISGSSQLKIIDQEIKIYNKVSTSRSSHYISVTFIPIRKNPFTGKYEKLVSCKLNIDIYHPKNNLKKSKKFSYTENSVLSSGKWVKIGISENGIYQIKYEELVEMGFNNPENIKLFGNGGEMLPKYNSQPRPDDLIENAIYIEKGTDNIFNSGDYILFYGQGPIVWNYNESSKLFYHTIHDFSDESYYFLTTDVGTGKKIEKMSIPDAPGNHSTNSYDNYDFHEINDTNLIKSGREWYGEVFDFTTNYDFNFYFPNKVLSDSLKIYYDLAARSSSESSFNINLNSKLIDTKYLKGINLSRSENDFAIAGSNLINTTSNSNEITISINYIKPLPSSSGYLNKIVLNTRSSLNYMGTQMTFRDNSTVGANNITEFRLSNTTQNITIWDITDMYNTTEIDYIYSNGIITFKTETDLLKEFIAFDGSKFHEPSIIGEIENQNLHMKEDFDFLIVSHPNFINQADRLAKFHAENDNLKVKVVTPDKIYNEFSSGKPDVSAIRDYVRMIYERQNDVQKKIRYLLLFGDGSFDNKSTGLSNTNYILTYQSENSIHYTKSFVTDDFFGLLDEDEGGEEGKVDIGIGRFPVQTLSEAESIVDKIINYSQVNNAGSWNNIICFIGDDEDSRSHMKHADSLSNIVNRNYPNYNIYKIMLDAYEQVNSSVGERYPDVNKAISDRIQNGSLIINYSGHGGELGLAHERIITNNDILSWENGTILPLFVTATCEFSRFDDKNRTSAGENIILNPVGGGIGLFTTTRIVYSNRNYELNKDFYEFVFKNDTLTGQKYRLGDIIRLTKFTRGEDNNHRNFTLLGDPALRLKYPKYIVKTDSINSIYISQFSDTLKAFDKVTIKGHIEDISGIKLTDYNGVLNPAIFDKPRKIITLDNDDIGSYTFYDQTSVLYKGKASISNGNFEFTFLIPKDIMYNYGYGKISYFGFNNEHSASGYNDILIGGTSDIVLNDSVGPEIKLFLNDENFINGGITDESPIIFAKIIDSSGVNTVGNGIGHDITAILDSNTRNPYVLNDYYESELDDYQKGTITYKLSDITKGKHNLKLKVWDILNNSTEETIDFIVAESEEMAINRIFNYPNPFTENTAFYFNHNQAFSELDVIIQIFSVSGKLVKTIQTTLNPEGFQAGPIYWDGLDDFGDKIGRGVYIYKVKIRSGNEQVAEKFEKLVILK